jgi:hypothetical protein
MAERARTIGVAAVIPIVLVAAMALALGGLASASPAKSNGLPEGGDPVHLNPADFSANIDNKRWPMRVGSKWVYRVVDTATGEVVRDVIKVTDETKMIADGIEARVVSDVVTDHGKPVEVTKDWYAQDRRGNVWYFGEDTIAYEHGKPTNNGSWEAGVGGAMPGVALPARPRVGLSYREEYSKGVAEDQSRVLALDEQATVPAGHFKNVLMTEDFSPIEPDVSEIKFYAKGSGQAVLAIDVSGGSDLEQLISYKHPPRRGCRAGSR